MAGVNKVILVGNLARDPEIRYTQDGSAVANFTLATTDKWKDKNSGEQKEKTEWHRAVTFNRLAEICGEHLHKGKQVYIEGKLQTRSWEKDGVTRYTTEIVAHTMKMLGKKEPGGSQQSQGQSGYAQQEVKPKSQPGYQDDSAQAGNTGPVQDDGIPF